MFEEFVQQPPHIFTNNKLINKLRTDKRWTMSTDDKKPVDANAFLNYNTMQLANIYSEPFPLVTLDDLDANQQLYWVNRTYHLNARNNRTFMIDIEPSASESTLRNALMYPANYTEISKRGGIHLFIEIPEDLITDENKYLFDVTVIVDDVNNIEYIFNNHYCTFTKRMVVNKPETNFDNDPVAKAQLKNILDTIVALDAKKKAIREATMELALNFSTENLHMKPINKLLSISTLQTFKDKQRNKTPQEFNNNMSTYERTITVACAGKVKQIQDFAKKSPYLKKLFEDFDDNDAVYATYLLAKDIIPERDKHKTTRRGLPYLMYQAQGSWSYILTKQQEQKSE